MLSTLLAANPQLKAIAFGLRRFLQTRRVIAVASDQRLVCCWEDRGQWIWRSGSWPSDSIRDGQPLQRNAIADLLAELLFDCDVVGAQLELVLPIQGSHWRVLDGVAPELPIDSADLLAITTDLNCSLDAADSYVVVTPCVDQTLLVGCPRSLLQAWIDVVEMADLPLRRVDWMVSSAHRGLMLEQQQWSGDIAWVFSDETSYRLVVIRAGIPELDCCIRLQNDEDLVLELRRRVAAWQGLSGTSPPLVWCFCLSEEAMTTLDSLIDPDRGETTVGAAELWMPNAVTADDEGQGLQVLERLALRGMREDIY